MSEIIKFSNKYITGYGFEVVEVKENIEGVIFYSFQILKDSHFFMKCETEMELLKAIKLIKSFF